MTPAEAESLGRRWLAAGGGWRAGMLSMDGWRVVHAAGIVACVTDGDGNADAIERRECSPGLLSPPDLRDPATMGVCLAVVRERLDSPMFRTDALYALRVSERCWQLYTDTHAYSWADGTTEAEALVRAMECAP